MAHALARHASARTPACYCSSARRRWLGPMSGVNLACGPFAAFPSVPGDRGIPASPIPAAGRRAVLSACQLLRAFSAPLPKRVVLSAFARRIAVVRYTSVTSATPRADPRIYRSSSSRPLVEKGNEIQRFWRLYENFCRASNGPDLLIRHVSSIWYS
jgi:hypothetical protein